MRDDLEMLETISELTPRQKELAYLQERRRRRRMKWDATPRETKDAYRTTASINWLARQGYKVIPPTGTQDREEGAGDE